MAILVKVEKLRTIKDDVTYLFYKNKGETGLFSVNSKTGALELITSMPDDARKIYFARAARKVMTEWQSKGFLPEKTFWAS